MNKKAYVSTLWVLGLLSGAAAAQDAIDIGVRRELLVDTALIQSMDGCQLQLKTPRDEGIALQLNSPWEGRFCGYTTIIRDGKRFRMYYRGLPDIDAKEVTCVAESNDGIDWYKPVVWRHSWNQYNATNIVLANAGPVTHNFCPFIDLNPQATVNHRYKALGGSAASGLIAYASPDGIQWSRMQDEPVLNIGGWVFDSQNVAFWSPIEQRYVLYFRRVVDGIRAIARTDSVDFVHWSTPVQMAYSDTGTTRPRFQLYTNQTHPYFRAPHIMLATAARFMPGRRVITEEAANQIGVDRRYAGDVSDAVLLTTRGGDRYEVNFDTALLRPGIGAENWVSRTNYPALGIVQTGESEMSWYVNQNYGQPTAHVHRYTFRLDGIASAIAPMAGGSLVTKPIVMSGDQFHINFATSAAGSLRVELQDAGGTPIDGFQLDQCRPLIGNRIEAVVAWEAGPSTTALKGRPLRIQFELIDAELFSFRFRGE